MTKKSCVNCRLISPDSDIEAEQPVNILCFYFTVRNTIAKKNCMFLNLTNKVPISYMIYVYKAFSQNGSFPRIGPRQK